MQINLILQELVLGLTFWSLILKFVNNFENSDS